MGFLKGNASRSISVFFTYHIQHRPYIILKWAETADRKIAANGNERLHISNAQTNRLVHKWRSEEGSILIGTNTALLDDPELTTRNWHGPSPARLVVDMELKLPHSLNIFNDNQKTIVFNTIKHEENGNLNYYQVTKDVNLVHQIVNALYQMKIQSVIVEGGAKLLQSFIDEGVWDEARVIKNEKLIINNGLAAPELPVQASNQELKILTDSINTYFKEVNSFSVK